MDLDKITREPWQKTGKFFIGGNNTSVCVNIGYMFSAFHIQDVFHPDVTVFASDFYCQQLSFLLKFFNFPEISAENTRFQRKRDKSDEIHVAKQNGLIPDFISVCHIDHRDLSAEGKQFLGSLQCLLLGILSESEKHCIWFLDLIRCHSQQFIKI